MADIGVKQEIIDFWLVKYQECKKVGSSIYFEYTLSGNNFSHWEEDINLHFWACVSHIQEDIFTFTLQDISSVRGFSGVVF